MKVEPVSLKRCRCGKPAVVFAPGQDAVREPLGRGTILLRRAEPARATCLRCAGLEKKIENLATS